MAEIPIFVLFTVACISFSFAFPQQGIWHVQFGKDQIQEFPKTMYKGTKVNVEISCQPKENNTKLHIKWVMRYSLCVNEYDPTEPILQNKETANALASLLNDKLKCGLSLRTPLQKITKKNTNGLNIRHKPGKILWSDFFLMVLQSYLEHPEHVPYQGIGYKNVEYIQKNEDHDCDGTSFWLQGLLDEKPVITDALYPSKEDQNTTQVTKKEEAQDKLLRKNRGVTASSDTTKFTSKSPISVNSPIEKQSQSPISVNSPIEKQSVTNLSKLTY